MMIFDTQLASHLGNDAVADRESQTSSFTYRFSSDERFKYPGQLAWNYTIAIIFNREEDSAFCLPTTNFDPGLMLRFPGRTLADSILGIQQQVDQNLLQPIMVPGDLGHWQ